MGKLWRRSTKWLSGLERRELAWLLVGLGGCILLLVFLALAGEVMEGETLAFDKKIVLGFRKADDLATPIGPAWITSVLDLTSLGGPTVLGLVVLSVIGFGAADALLDGVLHLRHGRERGMVRRDEEEATRLPSLRRPARGREQQECARPGRAGGQASSRRSSPLSHFVDRRQSFPKVKSLKPKAYFFVTGAAVLVP